MNYKYTSTLRINMENISDLFEKLDKYKGSFDEVLVFNQFVHSPKGLTYHRKESQRISPVLEELKKRGIRAGLNIHNTIGFFPEAIDEEMAPYKKAVAHDGNVNKGRICSDDKECMEYIKEQYRIYAGIKPDMIYVDDDTSSLACACDGCIKRFSKLHPEVFGDLPHTLETFQNMLNNPDISIRHMTRKAWIEFNALRHGELFENIEQAVHEVNPDIILGVMSFMSGADGLDTDNWAKKLSGPDNKEISWRPGRGVYTDHSMPELIEKTHRISAQVRYLPSFATKVESEIENFPYQSLTKSPSFTAFEAFMHQASGCTGTTFNVMCKEEEIGEEHEVFFKMAKEAHPYGEMLTEAFQRKALCGAGFWWDKTSASHPSDENWKFYKSVPTESDIFNIGIPYSCDSDNMSVYFMDKSVAMHIPDDELLKCLSKGVLMDAEALSVINERGYGEYTGFKTIELYMKDSFEQELEHPLNMPTCHKRNIRQAFAWATKEAYTIEKTNDKAEYMSEHYDLFENLRGMASGIFENSLGGRICVEGITPFDFCYSLPRCTHVRNVIRWLSKDTLPAYINSFHRADIWSREDCAFVANTAMEDAENLEVVLKTDAEKINITVSKGAKIVFRDTLTAVSSENGYAHFIIPEIPMLGTALITYLKGCKNMKEALFNVNTVFESDTYYTFDKENSNVYLADTKKADKKKYMTIAPFTERPDALDTAFLLQGLKNVTLDFGGALITLHGKMQPFLIDECENITIKNAIIEYERSFFTEFDVLSHEGNELHLKAKDKFPCRVENGYFIPYCKDWEITDLHESGAHFIQAFDKKTKQGKGMKVIYLGEEVKLLESPPIANIEHVKVRTNGDEIIFLGTFPEHWNENLSIVLCHTARDISSVAMYHSKNITIDNFRILNGAGMGYYAIYTENITLNKIGFFSDELSHGIVTNGADGVHFVGCKGEVKIYDSVFHGMIDDTLNIHSVYHLTSKVSGNVISALRTKYSGCLEAVTGLFGIGDTIAVYNGMTMEEKARFIIQDINLTEDSWVTDITVDGNTDNIAEGDVIENISTNPSLHFKNTEFKNANTHQRLQTRGKSLIENCTYDVPMWLTGDMNYWFESSPVNNLTVRNCKFIGERAIVALRPNFTPTEKAPYYHTGVTVENCTFDNPEALVAKFGDDVKFIGNKSSSGEKLIIKAENCGRIIEE